MFLNLARPGLVKECALATSWLDPNLAKANLNVLLYVVLATALKAESNQINSKFSSHYMNIVY